MVKRFWACKVVREVEMEFAVSFDKRKDAERYIKMDGDLYPSSTWTVLEVWQKEVK